MRMHVGHISSTARSVEDPARGVRTLTDAFEHAIERHHMRGGR
jgi:hypothetical protein